MGLTLAERETIVTMDDAGKVAHVYSAQPRILGRLRRNPAAVLVEEGSHEGASWARYEIPARLVSFRSVTVRQELTEEQKQARREQLARIAASRHSARAQSALDAHPGVIP